MKNAVDEMKETKIFRSLDRDSPDFAARIVKFVECLSPLLATTVKHFPFYTRHDAHHGFNVVRRIEQTVNPACFELENPFTLTASERFLLMAASYAHDLGMTVFPGEEDSLLTKLGIVKALGWETDPRLQQHLRAEHSKRGGQFIGQNADDLGIPKPLTSALDKMMRAHNLSIAQLEADLRLPYAAEAKEIDVQQLAAMICVADALEFSDTRVVDGVIDKLMLDPSASARISYQENMKHVCVGGSLAVRADGSILVSGTFSEEDVLALAHRTMDEIEHWVHGYCDIDRRSKKPRLLVRAIPIERNLNFTGGRFERLGVRLNKKNVIDLIASNAVWRDNRGIAIRELVQNAVEACRYRSHNSSASDPYVPSVSVSFNRANRSITVFDNGCGMSERTVLNNFLTVGSSRSREPGYSSIDYAPIARFGIGFWSVFTIAEDAHIETAEFETYRGASNSALTVDGFTFDVSLDDQKEYTVFRPLTRPCGTSITLSLRPHIIIDDVYDLGRRTLLCSEIPVTFEIDGTREVVPCHVPDVQPQDVFGERGRVMIDNGVELFQWRGEDGDVEIALGIAYRMENGRATFMATSDTSLSSIIGFSRYRKAAVCGFVVPLDMLHLCIDSPRVGTYFVNRRSPDGLEFTIDRQKLQMSSVSEQYARRASNLFHEGYRAFLDKTGSMDAETIAVLRTQAATNGGNVYDQFTDKELVDATDRFPDLMAGLVWPVFRDKEPEESSPFAVDLKGFKSLTGTIFCMQRQPIKHEMPGDELHVELEGPGALRLVYQIVRSRMAGGGVAEPAYVMAPDRLSSMLFDADPESSVRFQPFRRDQTGALHLNSVGPYSLCIQFAKFARMSFDTPPQNILAQVTGRWAGAVYEREFDAPGSKPYLFLGRHRVLVAKASKLAVHLAELASEAKTMTISNLISDLAEDDQGYTPPTVARFL